MTITPTPISITLPMAVKRNNFYIFQFEALKSSLVFEHSHFAISQCDVQKPISFCTFSSENRASKGRLPTLGPAGGHAPATLFGRPPVHQSLTECSKTPQFLTHLGLKSSNPNGFLNISLPKPSTVIFGRPYRKSNPPDLKNIKK